MVVKRVEAGVYSIDIQFVIQLLLLLLSRPVSCCTPKTTTRAGYCSSVCRARRLGPCIAIPVEDGCCRVQRVLRPACQQQLVIDRGCHRPGWLGCADSETVHVVKDPYIIIAHCQILCSPGNDPITTHVPSTSVGFLASPRVPADHGLLVVAVESILGAAAAARLLAGTSNLMTLVRA
jgi:hypothetical protein